MSLVLVQLLSQVRLVWPWQVRGCTRNRHLDLLHTTGLANRTQTIQEINSMLAMYVVIYRSSCISVTSGSVSQLPYQAGWQDLKDLFRSAGNIVRADINIGIDGRPKGSGTVIFETSKDAQQAISKFSSSCLSSCFDPIAQPCTTASTGMGVFLKSERYRFSFPRLSRLTHTCLCRIGMLVSLVQDHSAVVYVADCVVCGAVVLGEASGVVSGVEASQLKADATSLARTCMPTTLVPIKLVLPVQ